MTIPQDIDDEARLVLAAQRGERSAFAGLVELYDRRLLYFTHRLLGNHATAMDVMQEVWLAAYRHLARLRDAQAFRTWIYRLAHDRAVTELRRQGKWKALQEPLAADAVDSTSEDHFFTSKRELRTWIEAHLHE